MGVSELIIYFQEAYARLFPNCYNKQGIQRNLPSYTPTHQGTICAKVYPEGFQSIKGNNCGLISDSPYSGGYIVGGHIHTDRTTCNIEDPQQKYRLKNRATD